MSGARNRANESAHLLGDMVEDIFYGTDIDFTITGLQSASYELVVYCAERFIDTGSNETGTKMTLNGTVIGSTNHARGENVTTIGQISGRVDVGAAGVISVELDKALVDGVLKDPRLCGLELFWVPPPQGMMIIIN